MIKLQKKFINSLSGNNCSYVFYLAYVMLDDNRQAVNCNNIRLWEIANCVTTSSKTKNFFGWTNKNDAKRKLFVINQPTKQTSIQIPNLSHSEIKKLFFFSLYFQFKCTWIKLNENLLFFGRKLYFFLTFFLFHYVKQKKKMLKKYIFSL